MLLPNKLAFAWCRAATWNCRPTQTLLVACCAQLQFQSLFTSVLIEIWAVIRGKCERRKDGGGSLLLGPPEPRRDGPKRESLFLLLRELGQTLLLLLTGGQNCQIIKHPVMTEKSLSFGFFSHLRQLSLSTFKGLNRVFLQSVVLQHRADIIHATQSDG